jgi:hypothetical protein
MGRLEDTTMTNTFIGPICGYVTTTGHHVCAECATHARLEYFGVGEPDGAIVHPSPDGVYRYPSMVVHYDRACDVCGWAIRRPLVDTK